MTREEFGGIGVVTDKDGMGDERIRICTRALQTYGFDSQRMMLFEEVGELLNALAKMARGRASEDEVITELADVSIMVEQMAIHFGYESFIKEKDRKIQRLLLRLNGN